MSVTITKDEKGNATVTSSHECPDCNGSGNLLHSNGKTIQFGKLIFNQENVQCSNCKGKGSINETSTYKKGWGKVYYNDYLLIE